MHANIKDSKLKKKLKFAANMCQVMSAIIMCDIHFSVPINMYH